MAAATLKETQNKGRSKNSAIASVVTTLETSEKVNVSNSTVAAPEEAVDHSDANVGIAALKQGVVNKERKKRLAHIYAATEDCVSWEFHNRDKDMLSYESCESLVKSVQKHGQMIPAIAVNLPPGSKHKYEIICGARRLWVAEYLKQPLIIEIQTLESDEEKFLVQDLENRDREDITALERSKDYERAYRTVFAENMETMAERLSMNRTTLGRYIEMAKLPLWLIDCYVDKKELSMKHFRQYKKLLDDTDSYNLLSTRANRLKEEGANLSGPEVLERLTADVEEKTPKAKKKTNSRTPQLKKFGKVTLKSVTQKGVANISFELPSVGDEKTMEKIRADFERLLEEHCRSVAGA